MDREQFEKLPFMGIVRGVELEAIEFLVEVIISSNLKVLEITMNTPSAEKIIRKAVEAAKGRIAIGAGTVLSEKDLYSALDSGATFIVMPVLIKKVAEICVKKDISFFPGALTPQEIYNAWNSGATMVKVFPARFFGPNYFKEIRGPFNDIKLLACGGVNANNVEDFFSSGASAVGFGGSIFKQEFIASGEFCLVKKGIEDLINGSSFAGKF